MKTNALRNNANLNLLVGLFIAANPAVSSDRLWALLECAFLVGGTEGIDQAIAIMRGPKREQEAQEATVRG